MSDTPRTDSYVAVLIAEGADADSLEHFARDLERELNAAKARIYHITDGFRREQNDIEQTCGKALGYPRFCDDQKAFPGSTDADGVCIGDHVAASIAAELANKYAEAMERVKRLEEAVDAYRKAYTPDGHVRPHDCFATGPRTGDPIQDYIACPGCFAERKAKEAKP